MTEEKSKPKAADDTSPTAQEETKKKRESPFLNTKVADKEATEEIDEEQLSRKQHSKIDDLVEKKALFNSTCKLFFLCKRTNKLETRGTGKIVILRDDSGMYRVVMVRDQIMLFGCNHYITKSSPLVKSEKVPFSWLWVAINDKSDAEEKTPQTTYFAKFDTQEDFDKFGKVYTEGQDVNAKLVEEKMNKKE